MSELHSFTNDMNNFFAESGNNFQIKERYFFNFFCVLHNKIAADIRLFKVESALLALATSPF